uniref:C-type lectin domain-containing protein n=1 Tax=Oryzias latipes TaxID=8090 RepID=A0A3P9IFS1_ORYLA
ASYQIPCRNNKMAKGRDTDHGFCHKCPKDWIQFQESCYFFYNLNSQWKPWNESQQLCQNMKSDLVVISSLEEQTFIKNTIQYYFDFWHGYWIGLRKVNNIWIWVDGTGCWTSFSHSSTFQLRKSVPTKVSICSPTDGTQRHLKYSSAFLYEDT